MQILDCQVACGAGGEGLCGATRGTRRTVQGRIATPHISRNNQPAIIDQIVSVKASTCVIAVATTKVAIIDSDLADRLLMVHDPQVGSSSEAA